jgi:hypothetical protein
LAPAGHDEGSPAGQARAPQHWALGLVALLLPLQLWNAWAPEPVVWGLGRAPAWLVLAPLVFLARPVERSVLRYAVHLDLFRLERRSHRLLAYAALAVAAGIAFSHYGPYRGSPDYWLFTGFFEGSKAWPEPQTFWPAAPFSSGLHALVLRTIGDEAGWSVLKSMRNLNCVSGALFLFVLCLACETLFVRQRRLLAFGLLATLGQTLHLMGFIEFTPTGLPLALLYLVLGVRTARGACSPFWPAAVLLCTVFFHGSFYAFAPSLVLLCALRRPAGGPALRAAAPVGVFVAGVAAVYALLYTLGGLDDLGSITGTAGGPFVPLRAPSVDPLDPDAAVELKVARYTMFSLEHAAAVLETHLFLSVLSPLVPVLLVLGRRQLLADPAARFLLAAAAFAFAYACVWNPDFGPELDLDLYLVSPLALSLLGAYLAFGPAQLARSPRFALLLLAFSWVHLFAATSHWDAIWPRWRDVWRY